MAPDLPPVQQHAAPATQRPRTNRLLAALPPDEMKAVRPFLEPVSLPFKFVFFEHNQPQTHAWFIHRGVGSMIREMADGMVIEVATIGPEGVVGLPLVLGGESMAAANVMQVPGEGVRIEAEAFRALMGRCPALRGLMLRHTLALVNQIAQNAACNRVHSIEERAARWLLMTHDRVHGESFPLTQEFLGQMLGVRRPTVSLAAGMLAKAGLIHYVRGQVTVLNRAGLEAAACECYRVIRDEYEGLVGTPG